MKEQDKEPTQEEKTLKEQKLLKEREEWLEKLPMPDRIKIVYSDREIVSDEDKDIEKLRKHVKYIFAVTYFKQTNGQVGTAFFCQMNEEWKPEDLIVDPEENLEDSGEEKEKDKECESPEENVHGDLPQSETL